MEALSVREYRNNLAAYFTKADNGEQVLIRRKNEIYALVKVGREDLMITPELQARIDLSLIHISYRADTKQTEVQLNEHISWKQPHTRKRQLPTLSRDSTAPGKEKIQRQG